MGFGDFAGVLGNRSVRRTWLSQIISVMGDMTAWVGANVLVFAKTGSSFDVAVLNGLTFAAWLGPAQVLTAALGRFPRLRVMIATDVFRALLYCLLVLPGLPLAGFFALYFVAMCNAPVFECTRSALMVDITPAEDLAPALGLMNSTSQAGSLLGFALGGALVALVNPRGLLVVNAATFVISAVLLVGVRPIRATPGSPVVIVQGATGASLVAAIRSLREAVVLRCVVLVVLMCLATGAAESITVVFASAQLHANADAWVGVLAAAMPAGALIGIALMRHRQSQEQLMRRSVVVCVTCATVVAALAPLARWIPVGLLLYGVLGSMALILGPTSALVTPRLPVAGRATAWSVIRGLVRAGELVGALVAGSLAIRLSPGVAITLCSIPVAVAAAVFLVTPLDVLRTPPAVVAEGADLALTFDGELTLR